MKLMSVEDVSQIAEVRRESVSAGRSIGLSEAVLGRIAISATEIATNQLKHAGGGQVISNTYEDHSGIGLQLVGLDRGPGISDISVAMRDGHSTAGSAGQGLGAIRRQSDLFEIATWPQRGTAILCRFRHHGAHDGGRDGASQWGAVCVPVPTEEVSGDAWFVLETADGLRGMVVDGLGHGPAAATAAMMAIRVAQMHASLSPPQLLERMHESLRATRGAAVAVFQLDSDRIRYAGVGNISGAAIRQDGMSRMVSINGTLGVTVTRTKTFEYAAGPGTLIVMHSDGIGTGWSLDRYPGLSVAHPSLIAAVLYRDFTRKRDDATVLVARVGNA